MLVVVGLFFSPAWFVLVCSGRVVSVTWACYHESGVMSQSPATPPENIEGNETKSPFALDFWLMNLGSKDTEKHVQDPEAYFKNFLPLKIPQ